MTTEGEPQTSNTVGEDEPMRRHNHARDDNDAESHEIGTHEIDGSHRRENEPIEVGDGTTTTDTQVVADDKARCEQDTARGDIACFTKGQKKKTISTKTESVRRKA